MHTNQKMSESLAVLAMLDSASVAASTVTTAWVNAGNMHNLLAIVAVGAFGASATVDAKLQQASDSSGTGAKDFSPAKAITQLLAAGGNNRQALINAHTQDLDVANGFWYVRLSVTVGTAATQLAAILLGGNTRFEDAATFNQAGVAQVV
jgi:hypothetical protein